MNTKAAVVRQSGCPLTIEIQELDESRFGLALEEIMAISVRRIGCHFRFELVELGESIHRVAGL